METKLWYESKMLWVSFLVFVAAVLKVVGGLDIPVSEDATWVAIALSVIQFLLRLVTKKPVVIRKS